MLAADDAREVADVVGQLVLLHALVQLQLAELLVFDGLDRVREQPQESRVRLYCLIRPADSVRGRIKHWNELYHRELIATCVLHRLAQLPGRHLGVVLPLRVRGRAHQLEPVQFHCEDERVVIPRGLFGRFNRPVDTPFGVVSFGFE